MSTYFSVDYLSDKWNEFTSFVGHSATSAKTGFHNAVVTANEWADKHPQIVGAAKATAVIGLAALSYYNKASISACAQFVKNGLVNSVTAGYNKLPNSPAFLKTGYAYVAGKASSAASYIPNPFKK